MQFPQIRMDQTFARLGLQILKPVQEITQPKAELAIRQTPARMEISRTPPAVLIDQSGAWADMGHKNREAFLQEVVERGREGAMAGIARRAEEGIRLRSIERHENAVVAIARDKTFPAPLPAQLTFIPRYGSVKMEGIPGTLTIDWSLGGVEIAAIPRKPVHRYTPGKVEGYMEQMNSLKIWVAPPERQVDIRL